MNTLYDIGIEIQKIREAINSMTIKGADNASYMVYAVNKCNDIIKAINSVGERLKQDSAAGQNGEDTLNVDIETDETPIMITEESEVEDGKQNRGAASSD